MAEPTRERASGVTAAPGPLAHVTLTTRDIGRGLAFYDAALEPLGLVRSTEFGDEEEDDATVEAAGWGRPDRPPVLWLVLGAVATTGAHVSLRADGALEVDEFFGAALAAGGTAHDHPRRWAIYRRDRYHAVVADPDGNLVEAVADTDDRA